MFCAKYAPGEVAPTGWSEGANRVNNPVQARSFLTFGTLLRQHRVAAGLSQEALAERAHMSSHGVSALERGYRRTPQRETVALLADALALSDEQRQAFEAAAARWVLLRGERGSSVTVGPWADGASSNLPAAVSSFIGRDAELDAVASLVREHRLVTLIGAGGVGKTQTALHAGAALSGSAGYAAWFIGFASIADESLVVPSIASTLGVQEVPGRSLFETLRAHLKNRTLLLIFDNCEHVVAAVTTVAEVLLAACPRLRILATSREPLRADGERTYRLPSLTFPSSAVAARIDAMEATTYGAIALFVDRASAVDYRLVLTDENAPIIAEICRRLDGIPLAIELAAARIGVLSVRDLARRLNERFQLLTGGSRAAVPRQKTLSALIDWSYDLLTPQEQQLLMRLAVFNGSFDADAATNVCGGEGLDVVDLFDLLVSLTDKSLVLADTSGEQARYRLLESTAAYALDKLSESGRHRSFARRHAEYFRDQILRGTRLDTGSFFAWLDNIRLGFDNCRAALEWALTRGNDPVLGATIASDSALWTYAGLASEGRYWIGLALEHVSEAREPRIVAKLRFVLGDLSSGKAKYDEGMRAVRLFELAQDARGAAAALRQVAFGLFQMRRLEDAAEAAERALTASRACDDVSNVGECLELRAIIETGRGDPWAVRALHTEALEIFKALGDDIAAANALANLAELEFSEGDPVQAVRLVTESLEIHLRGKSPMDIAALYGNSAAYRIALDDLSGARESARNGLKFARQAEVDLYIAIGLQHLASLAALDGDRERAAKLLGYVEVKYRELGYEREGTEQYGYDKLIAALRSALSEDDIVNLGALGARFSEDQAVEQALLV
jgi:predicted ATPase/transcriptional regulator with XRE-family HTH domain